MTQYAHYVPVLLFLTLTLTACGTTYSNSNVAAEEMYLRTLSTQGMADAYTLDAAIKSCNMKQRIDRDTLYAYNTRDGKTLSFDGDMDGSVMVRLDIKHNPFTKKKSCYASAHGGLAATVLREARSGELQKYSQEIVASIGNGDVRELARDIDREFGSGKN